VCPAHTNPACRLHQIFGNHDDANLYGTNQTKTSRAELLVTDQQFPLSLSQYTPGLFGTSNYLLEVHYPSRWSHQHQYEQRKDTVALQLFFLDSGGGVLPEMLEANQIQWFRHEHRKDIEGAIVFQHIPATQFAYNGKVCSGLHEDPVDSIRTDPGIVHVLQTAGNVQWLASGHDHGNDYCCSTNFSSKSPQSYTDSSSLHVCFGRHSGYGGYGKWDRGARVYELELTRQSSGSSLPAVGDSSLRWKSWVRNESGSILDRYDPFLKV
jgi:hypothetical protein